MSIRIDEEVFDEIYNHIKYSNEELHTQTPIGVAWRINRVLILLDMIKEEYDSNK